MISANLSPGLMMFDVSLKILRALWRDVERCGEMWRGVGSGSALHIFNGFSTVHGWFRNDSNISALIENLPIKFARQDASPSGPVCLGHVCLVFAFEPIEYI